MKIETKKFVRKITAVASAALMTMIPLSSAFAAADLANLTDVFITNGEFDAYVAVGTGGGSNFVGFAKDVAGAIEVAAAFAQKAYTTTSASGTAVLERNQTAQYVNDGKLYINEIYDGPESFTSATTGYNWLVNKTVQDSAGNDIAKVVANLTIGSVRAEVNGNYSIDVGQLKYNLTFNNTKVGVGVKGIPLPDGNEYQISNISIAGSNVNVTLGVISSFTLHQGDTAEIGSTGVTITTNRSSGSGTNGKVEVKIKDASGNTLVNTTWNASNPSDKYVNDTLGVTIDLRSLTIYNDGTYDAVFDWSTSSVKLQGNTGKESTQYPGWKIEITNETSGNITSIAWVQYDPNGAGLELEQGTTTSVLNGLFNIIAASYEINSTNKVASTIDAKNFNENWEIKFKNNDTATTHYIDLSTHTLQFSGASNLTDSFKWLENINWKLQCIDNGSGMRTVTVMRAGTTEGKFEGVINGTPWMINQTAGNITGWTGYINVTWNNNTACTNQQVNVTLLNFTTNESNPLGTLLAWNLTDPINYNGTLTLNQNGTNDNITITYKGGAIDTIAYSYSPPLSGYSDRVTSAGDEEYTPTWGTYVKRVSSSEVQLIYPEAHRIGKLAVGRMTKINYTLSTGEYNSILDVALASAGGDSISINNVAIGFAKLDSEIDSSALDKPIILVGGPAVNSLVKELADANKTKAASEYEVDRAYVDLIENAFNNKTALVIAGYAGDDTRLAARVVASQVLNSDMGLSGTSVTLNTAGATYTDVTVV